MIDVVRSTEPEIVEIERAEIRLRAHFRLIKFEIAEIRFVDAVFLFVVAVALVAVLIDFRVDVLIAPIIDVLIVDALMILM